MKHKGTKALETQRLLLRPFALDDASSMYNNWACDSEVTKYLLWPAHESVEVSKYVLGDWVGRYNEPDFYLWAIVPNEFGEPVGSIGVVHKNDKIEMVHIGYCIGRKWWGQGITAEAFLAIIQFLFREVGVNRIESRHDANNPSSGKVMEKCGLKYEGIHREAGWNNQGRCDEVMYAILAKDYNA